ncbi:MAG: T9SS type A sorting domain-containing protein, partial [Bacteroidales bacterium]|nr:T9SS type A sorting domain-containing protein [Bacteroidales bacterium]
YLAGHSIGSFAIYPVAFYPLASEIRYMTSVTVEVISAPTVRAAEAQLNLNNTARITERIVRLTENPDMLESYSYPPVESTDDMDMLLITKNNMISWFSDYITYKESAGFIVEIISTEEIYSQYTGQDDQDKIRNCIIDHFQNHNLSFVLLAGDADPNSSTDRIIPHRGFYAVDDLDIPADMYYCCLDGTWNNDGDNRWGEPGETDLYAELAIGRLCVDSQTEVNNFTNKLKLYQDSPVVADIEKGLMVGEQLNNNPMTWGGDYKDQIADGSSAHGFTTAGFTSNFVISELYERDMNWNKSHVFAKFSTEGTHLLNHLGHSSPTYNMKMYTSDLTTTNFTNNGITRGFVIGYSQGCYNGSFDNRDWDNNYGEDCFAEKITTIATAEVASLANSRYGWYSPGNTNSSSQYVDRQFFDALFGEEISLIGNTNADSKEDNASYFNNSEYMRWTVYNMNLFGDPSMDIWTADPVDIVTDYPQGVSIGSSEITFDTDAPFARIGLFQNNALIGRALADADGNATLILFDPLSSDEPIDVSIIAHNRNRHNGTIMVVTNQPYVLFNSYQVHDPTGNNNGTVDFGEYIDLGLGVKNVGDQPATGVVVIISTQDSYCTITDDTETYGNLAAGEIKFIDNSFAFEVTDDIPDQHILEFNLVATGDSTWTSVFSITVCAPVITPGTYTISDPTGNNNGHLDPGETADISFDISNTGHSDAPDVLVNLTSASGYLTVNTSGISLGTLAAGQTQTAVFSVTAGSSTPIGTMGQLNLEATSGNYSGEKQYAIKIGLIFDDFETGNFSMFDWQTGGSQPWEVTTSNPYEGSYCAVSGNVSDNQFSLLMLNYESMYDDSVTFWVKVSSEDGYDYLKFYIGNQVAGQWAGTVPWTRVSFPVEAGSHSFKWQYIKDTYVSSGQDCAWIDFATFPAPLTTSAYAGVDDAICEGSLYTCLGAAFNYTSLLWTTSGTGTFNNTGILEPEYTPSEDDILNGSVELTLTVTGPTNTVSDYMILTINQEAMADAGSDFTICETGTALLTNASASGYSSLNWSTSGDGYFDDNSLIHPEYFPGPGDIASGSVILTLTASGQAPCPDVQDQAAISIIPQAEAFAGNDGGVCSNGSFTIQDASVSNSNTIQWSTAGDGIFDDPSLLHPAYTPGIGDVNAGSVILTLTVSCPPCADVTDEMTLTVIEAAQPEAGADAEICHDAVFHAEGGIGGDYDSFVWSTSGDGSFDNPYSLSAIYTPGTQDIAGMGVTLTLTASGTAPCEDVADHLQLSIKDCSSIGEMAELHRPEVYPNPGDGSFFIRFQNHRVIKPVISVLNIMGQVVQTRNDVLQAGQAECHINIPFGPGIYYLRIEIGQSQWLEKIVIR